MTTAAAHRPAHDVAARQLVARVREARGVGLAARRRAIPRSKPPLLIESDYAARLVGIVDQMRAAARHLLDALPGILRADAATGVRADADPGRAAREAMERVRRAVDGSFDPHAFERMAAGFGERVSAHQKEQLGRQVKAALGVDVLHLDRAIPPLIQGFVHENVALIKSLQGRTLDSLETLVTRAAASGLRAEHIQADIASRFGIEERHARLVARDQIGKLNGRITAARHQDLGIRKFAWLSMLDNKVRPEHRILHGQVFSYDKLPAAGLPGSEICCRCCQQPILDDVHAELGDQPAKSPVPSPTSDTLVDALGSFDYGAATKAIDGDLDARGFERGPVRNVMTTDTTEVGEDGYREWDGRIVLRPGYARGAFEFAERWETEAGRAALQAESVSARLDPARPELGDGVRAMLHEHLHGYGPLNKHLYTGFGAVSEEVATEMVARSMMAEHFGLDMGIEGERTFGAYAGWINGAVSAIREVYGVSPAKAWSVLTKASTAYKKIGQTATDLEHELLNAIHKAARGTAAQRGRLRGVFESKIP